MDFGKLVVAVLKVLVCCVGFAIGVSLFLSIIVHHVPELYEVWIWGGALFGLCVGVCWAIERREVRIAFVVPTLAGLLVCLVLVYGSGPEFVIQDSLPLQVTYSSSSWPPRARFAHEGIAGGFVGRVCMGAFTSRGIWREAG